MQTPAISRNYQYEHVSIKIEKVYFLRCWAQKSLKVRYNSTMVNLQQEKEERLGELELTYLGRIEKDKNT